jgi:hypothetical protein
MKIHYKDRDSIALGQLYVDHVMAMTSEGLHDKSAIADELAWRDLQIKMLKEDIAGIVFKHDVLYKYYTLTPILLNSHIDNVQGGVITPAQSRKILSEWDKARGVVGV